MDTAPDPRWLQALTLLRADAPEQIMGAPQDWPRWQELLPHMLTLTTHPDLTDTSTTTGQAHEVEADLAWLLDRAATYLQVVRGQPAAASPLAEHALTITEAALGPDHPDLATGLSNGTRVLQVGVDDLGDVDEPGGVLDDVLRDGIPLVGSQASLRRARRSIRSPR